MIDYPEGTIGLEIREIYDGVSVWKFPDGTLHNRWTPDDGRRFGLTQEWIDRQRAFSLSQVMSKQHQ
jgi:hypothetical protein